jgi:hypothetical protein
VSSSWSKRYRPPDCSRRNKKRRDIIADLNKRWTALIKASNYKNFIRAVFQYGVRANRQGKIRNSVKRKKRNKKTSAFFCIVLKVS